MFPKHEERSKICREGEGVHFHLVVFKWTTKLPAAIRSGNPSLHEPIRIFPIHNGTIGGRGHVDNRKEVRKKNPRKDNDGGTQKMKKKIPNGMQMGGSDVHEPRTQVAVASPIIW